MSQTAKTGKSILESISALSSTVTELTERVKEATNELATHQGRLAAACTKLENITVAGSSSENRRLTALYKKLNDADHAHIMAAREENIKNSRTGSIRVGKLISDRGARNTIRIPYTEGYLNIVVTGLNKTGVGAQLNPSVMTDAQGRLLSNIWSFSKLYPFVPEVRDESSNWAWPREVHINPKTQEITPKYWAWRDAGMGFSVHIRSPVPTGQSQYLDSYVLPDGKRISEREARIRIYCANYIESARTVKDFAAIRELLKLGYNIQIVDTDGPENTSGRAYGESGVGSIEITEDAVRAIIRDSEQSIGHGYALACALLDHPEWMSM